MNPKEKYVKFIVETEQQLENNNTPINISNNLIIKFCITQVFLWQTAIKGWRPHQKQLVHYLSMHGILKQDQLFGD